MIAMTTKTLLGCEMLRLEQKSIDIGYFAMEFLTHGAKPAVVGLAECSKPTSVVVSDGSDDNEDAFGK